MSVELFMVVAVVMERQAAIAAVERRAQAVSRALAPDRVQPHSRKLPSEAELDAGRFAVRQLELAADDIRADLERGAHDVQG